jgi:hypothetical protein
VAITSPPAPDTFVTVPGDRRSGPDDIYGAFIALPGRARTRWGWLGAPGRRVTA